MQLRQEHDPSDVPLVLDVETMRRTGYDTVDALVELMGQPDPVIRRATPDELGSRLHRPPPEHGVGTAVAMEALLADVLPYASKIAHPGYFAYIPGSTTWPAALAELVGAVANVYCGSWMEAAGPSQVELTVLDWFRSWIGMPEGTDGVLVSGGSAANLTALAAARELRLGPMDGLARIYCGDQTHSSVGRAARVLGFRPDQVHVIPSDAAMRIQPQALRAAIEFDLARGHRPLAVVAAAGSTNAGAVDQLPAIADLCRELGVWLHVDAAYGGFAALTARGAEALRGLERADSVTLDPHKWFFQPVECGALLVRHAGALERAFAVLPDYLADADAHGREVNFSDRGLQLTRGARSLKVWTSVQAFGVDAFRRAIDRGLDLADLAAHIVRDDERLELMTQPSLGIVCLRRTLPGATEDELAAANSWLAAQLEATGRALVSSTRLHGRFSLRMCVLNNLTREEDVRFVLEFLAGHDIPDSVTATAVRHSTDDTPLLSLLGSEATHLLQRRAFRRTFRDGATIVSRWATDRDFYVVLDGQVEIHAGDPTTILGIGDFFGEVAASDWGSGFGYVRIADVTALGTAELLMVPNDVFATLMTDEPAFRERVGTARSERMPRP